MPSASRPALSPQDADEILKLLFPGESTLPPPPAFGHAMKAEFGLSPSYLSLNHGSFGATPLKVEAQRRRLLDEVESNPDMFYKLSHHSRINEALRPVAQHVLGVDPTDLVFVENATGGVSTCLRSLQNIIAWRYGEELKLAGAGSTAAGLEWRKPLLEKAAAPAAGKEVKKRLKILRLSTVYHFVGLASSYAAATEGMGIVEVPVSYPISDDEIVARVRSALEKEERDGNVVVCGLLDAITSVPGVKLPLESLIPLLRSHRVFAVIDAAHAIGQIDLKALLRDADPDVLVTNLHKWCFGPRSSAVLYHSPRHHRLRPQSTTPHLPYGRPIISHAVLSDVPVYPITSPAAASKDDIAVANASANDWRRSFLWSGTADASRYLAAPAAVAFRRWIGGEEVIMAYCHDLAVRGGQVAAKVWGTKILEATGQKRDALYASMVNVVMPEPAWVAEGGDMARNHYNLAMSKLQERLLRERNMSAQLYMHQGIWLTRFSAQIYNEESDFEVVSKAILELIKEIKPFPSRF
ncbi:hypothetical protein HDU96_003706 [Phlyctochytrium bullatum]|nr:hypothetical protein HDU96_003706 [Phlyctochytrium bullatum]